MFSAHHQSRAAPKLLLEIIGKIGARKKSATNELMDLPPRNFSAAGALAVHVTRTPSPHTGHARRNPRAMARAHHYPDLYFDRRFVGGKLPFYWSALDPRSATARSGGRRRRAGPVRCGAGLSAASGALPRAAGLIGIEHVHFTAGQGFDPADLAVEHGKALDFVVGQRLYHVERFLARAAILAMGDRLGLGHRETGGIDEFEKVDAGHGCSPFGNKAWKSGDMPEPTRLHIVGSRTQPLHPFTREVRMTDLSHTADCPQPPRRLLTDHVLLKRNDEPNGWEARRANKLRERFTGRTDQQPLPSMNLIAPVQPTLTTPAF